jgi:hypothetical protein
MLGRLASAGRRGPLELSTNNTNDTNGVGAGPDRPPQAAAFYVSHEEHEDSEEKTSPRAVHALGDRPGAFAIFALFVFQKGGT